MMKTVIFEGDSLDAIRLFPERARQRTGYEISRLQQGMDPLNWKPFTSIGSGVREIRIQIGMQYRVIYITTIAEQVCILHAFEKKSQKTAKFEIELAKNAYEA